MRSICAFRAQIFAVLLVLVVLPTSANLIYNGSFEERVGPFPVGWRGQMDPYGAWFVLWEFGAHDGQYAAYCDAPDGQLPTWFWTAYNIPPGDYRLTAWANPINGAGEQSIYFHLNGVQFVWALSPGWNYLQKNVSTDVPAPLRIGAWNQRDDGLLLDDVRLEPVPEPWGVVVVAIGLVYSMLTARKEWRDGNRM